MANRSIIVPPCAPCRRRPVADARRHWTWLMAILALGSVLASPAHGTGSDLRTAAGTGAAAGTSTGPATGKGDDTRLFGTWRNPGNSVHVEIMRCADALCGVVVWASEKARRDARQGGTETLVGTGLLRDLRPGGPGTWRGKVFVPDLNRTMTGTVTLIDDTHLRARSCALGLICKSQVWERVR